MLTELRNNLFQLKIPMPNSSLDHVNSYIVKGERRSLIIDTGLNDPICLNALQEGLKKLDIPLSGADLFITHLHGDHVGLVPTIAFSLNRVYISRSEIELLRGWRGWEQMATFALSHGYSESAVSDTISKLPYNQDHSFEAPNQILMDDGIQIDVDGYHFIGVLTSGHAYGHMCLYEAEKKLLIAGDHVLKNITPSLQCWNESRNSLGAYLKSLERVDRLDIDLLMPGHQDLIYNHHRRISELKAHHEARCREILNMLQTGSMTVFDIAAGMTWDIGIDNWEDFPMVQKWFAFGEAMAHVIYLEGINLLQRTANGKVFSFSINLNGPQGGIIP